MKKQYLLFFLCFSVSVVVCGQNTYDTDELTVPATQSEELDVLLDPWTELLSNGSELHEETATPVDNVDKDQFFIDMQIRGRGEYRYGQGVLHGVDATPAWFVNDRMRLSLGYQRGLLSAKVSAQHVGVWGDDNLESSKGKVEMNEAWGRLDSKGWFLQFGRQILSYDDERIFGAEDWSATGYSHDAVRFGFEKGVHRVHGLVGFNQLKERTIGGTYYDGSVPYKNIQFLWYHFGNENRPFQMSLMGLNQGYEIGRSTDDVEVSRTGYMQLAGAWLQYKNKGFYGKAEGYYELGHDENQRQMSAYLAGARAGYEGRWFGLTLGGDYVSGAKTSSTRGTNNRFKLLYGSDHEFYGAMDYFCGAKMLSCGLIDGLADVYFCPMKGLKADLGYHYFATGVKRSKLHRQLGHELDFRIHYNILKDVSLEAGYSLVMPTSVMVYFLGGSNKTRQDWGWVSLNFSPRVFSTGFRR